MGLYLSALVMQSILVCSSSAFGNCAGIMRCRISMCLLKNSEMGIFAVRMVVCASTLSILWSSTVLVLRCSVMAVVMACVVGLVSGRVMCWAIDGGMLESNMVISMELLCWCSASRAASDVSNGVSVGVSLTPRSPAISQSVSSQCFKLRSVSCGSGGMGSMFIECCGVGVDDVCFDLVVEVVDGWCCVMFRILALAAQPAGVVLFLMLLIAVCYAGERNALLIGVVGNSRAQKGRAAGNGEERSTTRVARGIGRWK